jgi:hypothetical protein
MEQLPLFIGIAAALMLGWWLLKKLFKLALYAGIIGVIAWLWYFQIR